MTTQSPDATEQVVTEAMIARALATTEKRLGELQAQLIAERQEQYGSAFGGNEKASIELSCQASIRGARLMAENMRDELAALPSNATTNASLVEAELRAERDALLQKPIDLAKLDSIDEDASGKMVAYYWWQQAQDARAELATLRASNPQFVEQLEDLSPISNDDGRTARDDERASNPDEEGK